ncbi:MAG: hypothetical protein NC432_13265 [Roseburia sp.]|nr:hypothetical protein [Roseburia sp.]MCM1096748.1 hypothetical protein [Ruminococcus flavefaciens]MCM1222772.1 hypothetical protein [Lachnospiraceae bacterium]
MKKRMMAVFLTAALMLQGGRAAAAQEYTAEGTAECKVSCQVASTYTVSIPAAVELTYSAETGTASGTFQVGVKGELLLNQMVQVEPTCLSVELSKGTGGNFLNGKLTGEATGVRLPVTVNLEKTRWYPVGTTPLFDMGEYVEISPTEYVYATGTVTTGEVDAVDTYVGTLVFTFGVEEYERKNL